MVSTTQSLPVSAPSKENMFSSFVCCFSIQLVILMELLFIYLFYFVSFFFSFWSSVLFFPGRFRESQLQIDPGWDVIPNVLYCSRRLVGLSNDVTDVPLKTLQRIY